MGKPKHKTALEIFAENPPEVGGAIFKRLSKDQQERFRAGSVSSHLANVVPKVNAEQQEETRKKMYRSALDILDEYQRGGEVTESQAKQAARVANELGTKSERVLEMLKFKNIFPNVPNEFRDLRAADLMMPTDLFAPHMVGGKGVRNGPRVSSAISSTEELDPFTKAHLEFVASPIGKKIGELRSWAADIEAMSVAEKEKTALLKSGIERIMSDPLGQSLQPILANSGIDIFSATNDQVNNIITEYVQGMFMRGRKRGGYSELLDLLANKQIRPEVDPLFRLDRDPLNHQTLSGVTIDHPLSTSSGDFIYNSVPQAPKYKEINGQQFPDWQKSAFYNDVPQSGLTVPYNQTSRYLGAYAEQRESIISPVDQFNVPTEYYLINNESNSLMGGRIYTNQHIDPSTVDRATVNLNPEPHPDVWNELISTGNSPTANIVGKAVDKYMASDVLPNNINTLMSKKNSIIDIDDTMLDRYFYAMSNDPQKGTLENWLARLNTTNNHPSASIGKSTGWGDVYELSKQLNMDTGLTTTASGTLGGGRIHVHNDANILNLLRDDKVRRIIGQYIDPLYEEQTANRGGLSSIRVTPKNIYTHNDIYDFVELPLNTFGDAPMNDYSRSVITSSKTPRDYSLGIGRDDPNSNSINVVLNRLKDVPLKERVAIIKNLGLSVSGATLFPELFETE